jgi:hypothetical protein
MTDPKIIRDMVSGPFPFGIKLLRLAKLSHANYTNVLITGVMFARSENCVIVNMSILVNVLGLKWNSINRAFRRSGFVYVRVSNPIKGLIRAAPTLLQSATKWKMVRYDRGAFNTATLEEEMRTQSVVMMPLLNNSLRSTLTESAHPQPFSQNPCQEEDYEDDYWRMFEEEL